MYPLLKTAATANKAASMGVGKAAIINVSSILGSIGSNGEGAMYAYRMSKVRFVLFSNTMDYSWFEFVIQSAINAATKSMSVDLKQLQILCVAMHPGWVKTDMGGKNAPLEINTACTQIVDTVLKLNETNNGCFIGPDGNMLPW